MINEAINQGYMNLNDYPFRKFKIQKEKSEHRVLTQNELSKLESVALKGKVRQRVLDSFLFCCYSGLRFSDYKLLTDDNILSLKGNKWLSLRTQKTNVKQKIPIYLLFEGKALKLVGKYDSLEAMNKIGCNADVNRILKDITCKAGIAKRVTFHTARHTFATLLLSQSIPITTIQRLLGHTSVKTTQIYSEVLD
ncbi:site-specific recombinase, phage integrase family, partial [gut metagenome]